MINNESLNNSNNNINAKYSRLISDYKSLRDKHNLIKNALILERERTKDLESLISDSDMQKRKLSQEQESLTFRNDLLTKQINSLRDELDREKQRKNRKISIIKGKDVNSTNEEIEVIKEELINKITECSTLHSQISSLQFEYQMETNNFRSAINDLENQLRLIKEQNSVADTNIRKTLAKEIDERTALESKLEDKDNLISKYENSEQTLKSEIKELKRQLSSRTSNNPSTLEVQDYKLENSDVDSVNSKDVADIKQSESLVDSLASTPNDAHLSSNEVYICSLLDKIGVLEQKINSLELSNQITEKRLKIDKAFRDLYEKYIIDNGLELPLCCQKKDGPLLIDNEPDTTYETMSKFYENKFLTLNKQIYQAVAKAALYYDEVKSLNCRLESEKLERDNQSKQIEILKQQIKTSQEDLEITRTQYDNKMTEMSIHISELSSQLDSGERPQSHGDYSLRGHSDNISSIKSFINSFKK